MGNTVCNSTPLSLTMAPSTSWYLKPVWACGPGFDVVANSQVVENRKILEVRVLLPYWNTVPWRPQEHAHLLVGEGRAHLHLEHLRCMYFL